MKHNEPELANGAFAEAKEQLPLWMPKAKEYVLNDSALRDFDEAVKRLQNDIRSIAAGNTTASDNELRFLIEDGSVCVEP